MRIIHGPHPLPDLKWPVVTLGTFDGVHLGHQRILAELTGWARQNGGEAVVITFATHPRTITTGAPSQFITSLKHRLMLLQRHNVHVTMVLDFDRRFAITPPEEFVDTYFIRLIRARGIVVGYNTRFGRNREGDAELLLGMGRQHGFQVRQVQPVHIHGQLVSSTAIRTAINDGNLERAAAMLGRPVSLYGTVVSGEGRGRQLGFPTANLDLYHETRPPAGVYAGFTEIDGARHRVLISIGNQPTFHAPDSPIIVEVYVLDFSSDLYGKDLEIQFLAKLRGQLQFQSAEELTARIERDIAEARILPLPE